MAIELTNGARSIPGAVGLPVVVEPTKVEEHKKGSTTLELPKKAVQELSPAEQDKKVKEAADKINEFIDSVSTDLQFRVDKDTGETVVKVLERKSGEVIRQIPSEEILAIAKALDTLKGLIIRKKA